MRVAIVNKFLYRLGGSQAVVMAESNLLCKAGWDVVYFGVNHPNTMEGLEEKRFFPDHMELSDAAKQYSLIKRFHFAAKILYNVQARQKFGNFLDYYKPDIIHCHNIYNHLSPSILHAAKARRIPVVMSLHDYHLVCPNYTLKRGLEELCSDRRCYGRKYWHCIINRCVKKSVSSSVLGAVRLALHRRMRWFENNLDIIIAPSQFIKDAMIEDGIPENKICLLYNTLPFELSQYINNLPSKGRITRKITIERQGKPFIYVGRLSLEKGVLTLAKAFAEMPEQHLWIVGTGPQESEIRDFVNKRRAKNISLFGYKKGEELWGLMQQSYMSCMPSECFEVMPVSLIETFALGIPAIGARIGGIPEVIHPGKTGLLFESGNIGALIRAVQESLLIDVDSYHQMSYQAQSWVQDNHAPEAHLKGLLDVYDKALLAANQ
jgi:glycosyltransferase involved in cell wall biosynthesis